MADIVEATMKINEAVGILGKLRRDHEPLADSLDEAAQGLIEAVGIITGDAKQRETIEVIYRAISNPGDTEALKRIAELGASLPG